MFNGAATANKNPWLGRNADGTIKEGSGTEGLNSAQFTPDGASEKFTEGWTRESVGGEQ